MVTLVRLEQLKNVLRWIETMLFGMVRAPVKPEQPIHAFSPMEIALSGMVRDPVKPEQ